MLKDIATVPGSLRTLNGAQFESEMNRQLIEGLEPGCIFFKVCGALKLRLDPQDLSHLLIVENRTGYNLSKLAKLSVHINALKFCSGADWVGIVETEDPRLPNMLKLGLARGRWASVNLLDEDLEFLPDGQDGGPPFTDKDLEDFLTAT